jgi:hypothetical protein
MSYCNDTHLKFHHDFSLSSQHLPGCIVLHIEEFTMAIEIEFLRGNLHVANPNVKVARTGIAVSISAE